MSRCLRRFARLSVLAALLAAGGALWLRLSVWPGSMLIRLAFDRDSDRTMRSMLAQVPSGIDVVLDRAYGPGADERLDVFGSARYPGPRPTVVWVHGGGWVSGNKRHVAPYLRILADHGYTTVGIDYSIAPAARYPMPLRQLDLALTHLVENAEELQVDPDRIVVAGDSAGAHIAAQFAALVADGRYAERVGLRPGLSSLAGVLLHCGVYDGDPEAFEAPGLLGWLSHTVLQAYLGERDPASSPNLPVLSVTRHVTADFPPAFISGGNGDPLTTQGRALAARLEGLGVDVETLFWPDDHEPALPHEYQFRLERPEAREALERGLAFLDRVTR